MHFHVYIIESSVGERERLGYWVCEPIENNIIGMIYEGVLYGYINALYGTCL
jgi:hypothetical protein